MVFISDPLVPNSIITQILIHLHDSSILKLLISNKSGLPTAIVVPSFEIVTLAPKLASGNDTNNSDWIVP